MSSLNITRSGAGPRLLFLHGIDGTESCAAAAAALAENHEVILPDHPGFGHSDSADEIASVSDLAYFYLDLMDELNLNGVDLVGHCLGGWIAAELAIRNTSRIRSLTLVASAGLRVDGIPMGDPFLWSPEENVRQSLIDAHMITTRLAEPVTETAVEIALKNQQAAARYTWSPRLHNPALRNWLHRIDVPTLIIWGDQDRIFPAAYAHAFETFVPQTELTIFKDCGHLPMLEKQEAFVKRLDRFLDDLPQ